MSKQQIPQRVAWVAICCMLFALAGCNGKEVQPEKSVKTETKSPQEALKSLPTVTLTGVKLEDNGADHATRIIIAATGAFGSNVVQKTDPDRIIVILHNALVGEATKNIEVNDGTINRVEIDQLDTGKGKAVRLTIGLAGKTDYQVVPAEGAVMIDVRKRH